MRYVFFGTPEIAVTTLEYLKSVSLLPELIITTPDKPQGRGMLLTHSPVKKFARANTIPFLTPEKITQEVISAILEKGPWDCYLVFAYGKILPATLLESVHGKVLNIHPSLLPKYRGPSPLQAALLSDDTQTGVTLMEMDSDVDHGPLLAQETIPLRPDTDITELAQKSAKLGGTLFEKHAPHYIEGKEVPTPQNHSAATYCKKIEKEDGLLTEGMTDWEKWKHYRAFLYGPGVYFFETIRGVSTRIKITQAAWQNDKFVITEVIPENQKHLSWEAFVQWKS